MKNGAHSPRINIARDYEQMSRRAEAELVKVLRERPNALFCTSAGGTPTRLYELLVSRGRREPELFSTIRVLQVDEWGGLPRNHPASCEFDLRTKLVEPLGIDDRRCRFFRPDSAEPEAECARMRRWLERNGPIDICLLGLGVNGHVAMIEPGLRVAPRVHVARLATSSLKHPMLASLKRKPKFGLSLGMSEILNSRLVLLIANGKHKRNAVRQMLNPTVRTDFPASFLWLHPNAALFFDQAAARNSNSASS